MFLGATQGEGKIPRRFTSRFRSEVAFIFNERSKITSHAGHLMTRHLSSSLVTQDILDIADFRGRVVKETAVLRRWGITMIIWFYQLRLECKLATVGFLKLTFRPLAFVSSSFLRAMTFHVLFCSICLDLLHPLLLLWLFLLPMCCSISTSQ